MASQGGPALPMRPLNPQSLLTTITETIVNDHQTPRNEDGPQSPTVDSPSTDNGDDLAKELSTNNTPSMLERSAPTIDQSMLESGALDNASKDIPAKAKEEVTVTIDSVSQRYSSDQTPVPEGPPWKRTFLQIGPLAGLAAIFLAAAAIIIALGILVGSRGQAKSSWTVGPSAYLAILSAIANQSMRLASFQGSIVYFWSQASKGLSLERLHQNWRSGTTVRGALTAGRHLRLVGLACIASVLVAVDGPLLQRATTIITAPVHQKAVNLDVTMAQELPSYWSGGWSPVETTGGMSPIFNATVPTSNGTASNLIRPLLYLGYESVLDWMKNEPLTNVVRGCPNVCKAQIKAAALAETSCREKVFPVNYTRPIDTSQLLTNDAAPPIDTLAFAVQPILVLEKNESIDVVTAYSSVDNNCVGTARLRYCTLQSAVGEYNATINNGVVTLDPGRPKILALANNTPTVHTRDPVNGDYPSTLGGVVALLSLQYQSAVSCFLYKDNEQTDDGTGSVDYSDAFMDYTSENQLCPSYRDPRDDFMQKVDEMMFSAGAYAALWQVEHGPEYYMDPGLPINVSQIGYLDGTQEVFETDLRWYAAALAVELICIALVLPTYWGWWKLGRSVSLSPLEIAKAFEAPMLAEFNSNSEGSDIAKAVKKVRVRYGETVGERNETKVLAFATEASVRTPQDGEQYA